jgi:GntR family transcriptional repressor for pyruvate dehydrogenase complex
MGILRARHGKGVFVADGEGMSFNPEVLGLLHGSGSLTDADLRQARLIIEPPLARLAAEQATRKEREMIVEFERNAEEAISGLGILDRARVYAEADVGFHQLVATASRNPILPMILKCMHEMLNRVRLEVLILNPDSVISGSADHRKIANAIFARDPEAAEKQMERHIRLRGAEFLKERATTKS